MEFAIVKRKNSAHILLGVVERKGKVLHRIQAKLSWVLGAALLVSLAANLYFATRAPDIVTRVLDFRVNHPFRPICFTQADGLVVLSEPMNERFKTHVLTNTTHSNRLGTDGVLYISLHDWKRDQEGIWNLTRQIAAYIYFERTGKKVSSNEKLEMQTGNCKFIRKYVLETPKAK
jgi:hypothetical protein